MPRLRGFAQAHPDISLNLSAAHTHSDFALGQADIDIRYGVPQWPDLVVEPLFEERIVPLASPAFIREHRLKRVEQLLERAADPEQRQRRAVVRLVRGVHRQARAGALRACASTARRCRSTRPRRAWAWRWRARPSPARHLAERQAAAGVRARQGDQGQGALRGLPGAARASGRRSRPSWRGCMPRRRAAAEGHELPFESFVIGPQLAAPKLGELMRQYPSASASRTSSAAPAPISAAAPPAAPPAPGRAPPPARAAAR